jgi:radical SAM superfamily enzyme YgiQ (UPF0313 family)
MTPRHWSCSYHEAAGAPDSLIDRLLAERPTLVAVSALTASILDAYHFCDRLRAGGSTVVIGGLHATVSSVEAQRHCDAVVVGEGEPVWQQVLMDAEAGQMRKEYRSTLPFDLSQSPVPRFDLLGTVERPRMTLQTERGCPFACEFCGASRMLGVYREKPLANIERELAAMQQVVSRPWLELADDNTFADRRDSSRLLELLASSHSRYFTESDWRVGERPDVLRSLAASGCVQVLVGIESLTFRYPGMGAKHAELDRMMDAVQAIQDSGVGVNGCVILGADGETNDSLDRMTEFLLESPLAEVQITLQTPFPGTGLHRRLAKDGRLLPRRDWSFYTLFDVTYQPDLLSVEELESGFRRVIQAVFSEQAALRRSRIRRDVWQKNPSMRR